VDQLGNFEDAVKRAEKIAGISNANLVQFQQRYDLSDIFKMFGKTEVPPSRWISASIPPSCRWASYTSLSPTFAK